MDGRAEVTVSTPSAGRARAVLEVLGAATRLGVTSFGGPVAHLGYYRAEYVERRRWVDEATFADLVALCQFLPGPASSQISMAIGIARAGLPGAIAAWIGFTLPSAVLMVAFAYGVAWLGGAGASWLHGLKVAAVAVVANAVWGMARSLAPDRERATIAIVAAVTLLMWTGAAAQIVVIVLAALVGWWWLPASLAGAKPETRGPATGRPAELAVSRRAGVIALAVFFACLVALPFLRGLVDSPTLAVVDSFYRTGSLVFGGGHVVLPLLQAEVVPPGWVTNEAFVAGYGAAQAVPGPLFTFAAYLGTVMSAGPGGVIGGAVALVAIFLPAFLLVVGALPFWNALRGRPAFRAALAGINAAVVGVLLAALYQPVWTSAIDSPTDVALALVVFALLTLWKMAPWLVVVAAAAGAAGVARLGIG